LSAFDGFTFISAFVIPGWVLGSGRPGSTTSWSSWRTRRWMRERPWTRTC
jgi:hypothetical protein